MVSKLQKETNFYMYLMFSLGILCALNYGIMVSNTPAELITKYAELTNFDVSRPEIFSTMTIGTSIGALIAQFSLKPIVSKLGLYKSLFVFIPLDILFNLMNCFPVHYIYFLFVMICIGFCTGSYLTLIPILAADQIDPKLRGMYMATISISINLGVLFGYILSLFIKLTSLQYNNWWAMHLVCAIFCIAATAFLYFTYAQKKKLERIRSEVNQNCVVTSSGETVIQTVNINKVQEVEESHSEAEHLMSDVDDFDKYKYSCKQKNRLVWISIILGTVQMTTGIIAMINYASLIFSNTFEGNPYSGNYGATIVGTCNLIGVIIAMPIIKVVNRKVLLGIGLFGTVATNIVIAITFASVSQNSRTLETIKIVMFVFFVLFYQLAPGPVILMQCGEVFPRSLKVRVSSIGFAFNWGWNIIVTYTYRFFADTGYIIHSLYAVITFILSIALLIMIPETRNKSEREVEKIIRAWK